MATLVSLVIPTHRRPQWLARAIRGALGQTCQPYEIIVVENGASHEAEAVVGQFQRQGAPIRYVYEREPDPCHARNVGIRAARGTCIALMDDDDEWLPHKLERQVAVLERQPHVGLVTCKAYVVNVSGDTVGERPRGCGEVTFQSLVTHGCTIWSLSSVLIRRECLSAVGCFDSRYFIANDYDLYLRIARRYALALVPEPLFRYTVHDGNLSRGIERVMQETVDVLHAVQPEPSLGVTQAMLDERISRCYHLMAVEARDAGEFRNAAGYYAKAIASDPAIGGKIPWARLRSPAYRFLRPYANVAYCGVRSLAQRTAHTSSQPS